LTGALQRSLFVPTNVFSLPRLVLSQANPISQFSGAMEANTGNVDILQAATVSESSSYFTLSLKASQTFNGTSRTRFGAKKVL